MISRDKKLDIPIIAYDQSNTKYALGQALGNGAFGQCFELKNTRTNTVYAGKVITKSILTKFKYAFNFFNEIDIQSKLNHPHVVKLQSHFKYHDNIYILLELCNKRSMKELHKRRKIITVPEVRYFMRQITMACNYLHENHIIHRDLKLDNLLLNNEMEIKVGDFGLATRLKKRGERKTTVCGTPNYMAPEVINKSGYSFEVDIWSIGCILYTLLVGVPPFETNDLQAIYSKIIRNDYKIPENIDEDAKLLIREMLNPLPESRPKPKDILTHRFLTRESILHRLPTSCLTTAPRISAMSESCFTEANRVEPKAATAANAEKQSESVAATNKPINSSSETYLTELIAELTTVNKVNPGTINSDNSENTEDPASVPFIWISRWISGARADKWGIGYELCDNTVVVIFRDNTTLLRFPNKQLMSYTCQGRPEQLFVKDNSPSDLLKKMKIFKRLENYMERNLLKAGESISPRGGDELAKVPYLYDWINNNTGAIFHLSNGTMQINFFDDHTKIIVCPVMGAVSFIDENRTFTTYNLQLITKYGCTPNLALKLQYAELAAKRLLLQYQHRQVASKNSEVY